MIPVVDDLYARRGATFGPRGWPLLDADGVPLRDPAGVVVVAQVRAEEGSDVLLHSWTSTGDTPTVTLGTLLLPGDDTPQVVALLGATATETATWAWQCCPYDVLVTAFGRTDQVVSGDFTVHSGVTRP